MSNIKVETVYPITKIAYPEGHESMDLILDSHLTEYTSPKGLESLMRQLRGQTRAIEGVYAHDVERWLNNKPNLD